MGSGQSGRVDARGRSGGGGASGGGTSGARSHGGDEGGDGGDLPRVTPPGTRKRAPPQDAYEATERAGLGHEQSGKECHLFTECVSFIYQRIHDAFSSIQFAVCIQCIRSVLMCILVHSYKHAFMCIRGGGANSRGIHCIHCIHCIHSIQGGHQHSGAYASLTFACIHMHSADQHFLTITCIQRNFSCIHDCAHS